MTAETSLQPPGATPSRLQRVFREPLLHFLLLGALLFALDAWLRPGAAPAGQGEIVVAEARIRTLAQGFQRTWQRPPTREELDGLIEAHVREEVMVREALALGLDRDDAIIRRRLQQKAEFVAEDVAAQARPSDQDLEAYLAAHAEVFRTDARVTFSQVYLDPAKRGDRLETDAARLLLQLNGAGAAAVSAKAGDPLGMLERRYENLSRRDVARAFGDEFAAALVGQPVSAWVGPIRSGYGAHLVRVESLVPGALPTLSDVRPLVEREWMNEQRKQIGKVFYERLRAKYRVVVQMPGAAKP